MDRRGAHRAPRLPLLVGVMGPEAGGVHVRGARHGVRAPSPLAVPGHVPHEEVQARVAVRHPLGEHLPDRRGLAERGHHSARAPVVAQPRIRPDQRVEVRGEDHRAVDHPPDPRPPEHRHALHRLRHVVLHAREVVGQQLVTEVAGGPRDRPMRAWRFVYPEQQALTFLAHVELRVGVVHERKLAVHRLDLRDRFGDEVMVLDRHQGQPDSCQRSHFACPQPGRVHHVLGDDGALLRHHLPGAVAARIGLQHRAVAHDLRATITRALRERMGDAARVDVPAVRVVQHALHAGRIEDRYERPGFRLVEPTAARSPPGAPSSGTARAPPCAARCVRASLRPRDGSRTTGRSPLRASDRARTSTCAARSSSRSPPERAVSAPPRCQVDPDVSSLRSMSRQSVQPRARQVVEHAATGDRRRR